MILLDTDIFSLVTGERPNAKVLDRLRAAPENVAITVVTQAEALEGRIAFLMRAADAEQLLVAQEWLRRTVAALSTLPIVGFDPPAAAELYRLLGTKGLKKVGRGDLMIAGIALVNKAILVTRNLKDFSKVPGLQLENWAD